MAKDLSKIVERRINKGKNLEYKDTERSRLNKLRKENRQLVKEKKQLISELKTANMAIRRMTQYIDEHLVDKKIEEVLKELTNVETQEEETDAEDFLNW